MIHACEKRAVLGAIRTIFAVSRRHTFKLHVSYYYCFGLIQLVHDDDDDEKNSKGVLFYFLVRKIIVSQRSFMVY